MRSPTREELRVALIEATKGLCCLRGMTGTKHSRAVRINIELGKTALALGVRYPSYQPDKDILECLARDAKKRKVE